MRPSGRGVALLAITGVLLASGPHSASGGAAAPSAVTTMAPSGPQPGLIAAAVFDHGIVIVEPGKPATYDDLTTREATSYPAWSPDGTKVAALTYTQEGTRASILIMDRSGSVLDTHPVVPTWSPDGPTHLNARGLSWSPDGTQLAMSCWESEDGWGAPTVNEGICAFDLTTEDFRLITNHTEVEFNYAWDKLDWSPDGEMLVFGGHEPTPCEDPEETGCGWPVVAVVETEGSGNIPTVLNNTQYGTVPDWSPDGREIVYWDYNDNDGPAGVIVIPAPGFDGGTRHLLDMEHAGWSRWPAGEDPSHPAEPVWSPDGGRIAFTTDTEGDSVDIFTVDAQTGGDLERSSQTGFAETLLAWGPPSPGCTIPGTPEKDVLKGTGVGDVICGQGGNDIIRGLGGDDRLLGGAGNDTILGGKGKDILLGEDGNDRLTGEDSRDSFEGGAGKDTLKAKDGVPKESVDGGKGKDACDADKKDDVRKCE